MLNIGFLCFQGDFDLAQAMMFSLGTSGVWFQGNMSTGTFLQDSEFFWYLVPYLLSFETICTRGIWITFFKGKEECCIKLQI